jgi:hypothetical protein
MALPIPKRFIGYGAFNLCFDRRLGRAPSTGGKNFFESLRKDPRGWPVNLVKVICFRKSTADKLDPARADPLFAPGGSVNPAFLTNLQTLVTTAEGCGFFVQICVFSFQSVTSDDETGASPVCRTSGLHLKSRRHVRRSRNPFSRQREFPG